MSAPISFGFSKKVQNKLVDSKLRDESTKEREEEKDFVKLVVGNEIQGTLKKQQQQEWVIPLIKQNKWRVKDDKKTDDKNSESVTSTKDSTKTTTNQNSKVVDDSTKEEEVLSPEEALKRQAVKELLKEANDGDKSDDEPDYEIPLLLQNRIPNGYEEDNNMDVSLRPEQSTIDDYEQFPVDKFGMAMLLGMGWKKQEGIGRTNKGHIEMKEPTLRPKGLGLGAEKLQLNKDAVPSNTKNTEESKLTLKIGAGALITKGSNKGLYGQIESFDEDNNRVILRLALSGKMADVSKFYIDLVPPSEYKQKSKVLNIEKYEKYKSAETDSNNYEDDRREHRNGTDKIERDSRHHSSNRNDDYDDDADVYDSRSAKKKDYRTEYGNDKDSPSSQTSSRRHHQHRRENYESINERDNGNRDDRDSRYSKRKDDDDYDKKDESRSSSRSHRKKSKKEKKSKSRRRERDGSSDSSSSASDSSASPPRDRDRHHKKKKSHKRKHRD